MSFKRIKCDNSICIFSSLPLEILHGIFQLMNLSDLWSFSCSNRVCLSLIRSAHLNETWIDCAEIPPASLSFLRDWHSLQKLELVNAIRPLPILDIIGTLTGLRTLAFRTCARGEIYPRQKQIHYPFRTFYLRWDHLQMLSSLTNLESILVQSHPGYQLDFVGLQDKQLPRQFPNLKSLTLENFQGHVMGIGYLWCSSLTRLNLRNCWMTNWKDLGDQTCLTELEINGGNFAIRNIAHFERLTNLQKICLKRVRCTEKDAPESIDQVSHLNQLDDLTNDMGNKFVRKRKKMTYLSKLTFV
eukprot:TRINITY_DN2184_c0_g1_i4.p1 TRINITY_DN2184_c0_g1~~TRINITY_DN2184_c0_g1_i4.p1  ORF type:complete len:300 (+),score=-1.72 TRINITY_DN2184_c0_g1_i4:143-1042(+)